MKKLTNTQLDNFVKGIDDYIEISLGDEMSIQIKVVLSETEKRFFVSRVVENSYINDTEYSSVLNRNAFVVTFAQMLTNLPIPFDKDNRDIVNVDKLCNRMSKLNIIGDSCKRSPMLHSLVNEIMSCIKEEIDFKNKKILTYDSLSNSTTEAIETFNTVMHKGLDLMDTAIAQLNKNGNKLFKNLTPKKISEFINGLQTTMSASLLSENKDDQPQNTISFQSVKLNGEN